VWGAGSKKGMSRAMMSGTRERRLRRDIEGSFDETTSVA
jgi:hypothetical protein